MEKKEDTFLQLSSQTQTHTHRHTHTQGTYLI